MRSHFQFRFSNSPANLFWKTDIDNRLDKLKTIVLQLEENYEYHFSLREILREIFVEAEKYNTWKDCQTWLVNQVQNNNHAQLVFIDVITGLPNELRHDITVECCCNSVDMETFDRIAFALPFSGKSSSGSEIPLIKSDIEYAEKLKSRLKKEKLYKYAMKCDKYIDGCKRYMNSVEVREFLSAAD